MNKIRNLPLAGPNVSDSRSNVTERVGLLSLLPPLFLLPAGNVVNSIMLVL